MPKNARLLMLVCALTTVGSADQHIGEQNTGAWAQAA